MAETCSSVPDSKHHGSCFLPHFPGPPIASRAGLSRGLAPLRLAGRAPGSRPGKCAAHSPYPVRTATCDSGHQSLVPYHTSRIIRSGFSGRQGRRVGFQTRHRGGCGGWWVGTGVRIEPYPSNRMAHTSPIGNVGFNSIAPVGKAWRFLTRHNRLFGEFSKRRPGLPAMY